MTPPPGASRSSRLSRTTRDGVSRARLWVLCIGVGCSEPGSAELLPASGPSSTRPATTAPAPSPATQQWELASAAACGQACVEEHWTSAGESLRIERRPRKLTGPGGHWMREWPFLQGVLRVCLGDPLRTPPGETRLLVTEQGELWWWLRLDGTGRCGLRGELALHSRRNRARLEALQVEGLAWSSGGRDRARDSLRAWLLAEARRPDSTLSDEERAWLELQLVSE